MPTLFDLLTPLTGPLDGLFDLFETGNGLPLTADNALPLLAGWDGVTFGWILAASGTLLVSTTNSSFNFELPPSIFALLKRETAARACFESLNITVATPVDLPLSLNERVNELTWPTLFWKKS